MGATLAALAKIRASTASAAGGQTVEVVCQLGRSLGQLG